MTTPDAPPPYRPLLRTRDDRVVAGVAGGLGRWLDIDPVIFRVTFAVLTLFGGVGLVAYLIGYLLIPDEATGIPLVSTRGLPDPRRLSPQQRALAGWAVAGLAVLVAIVGHRSTTVAVLLIVAAVIVVAAREGHRPVGAAGFSHRPRRPSLGTPSRRLRPRPRPRRRQRRTPGRRRPLLSTPPWTAAHDSTVR